MTIHQAGLQAWVRHMHDSSQILPIEQQLSGPAHTGSSRLGLLLLTTCSVLICSLGCEGGRLPWHNS